MKFAIQVNSSPHHGFGAHSAYHFILSALALGHSVKRVFFYHDGIYNGMRHAIPAAGETSAVERWSALARNHGIDLVVCISAAQRRGILSMEEAARVGSPGDDLAPGFRLSGLAQLAEGAIECDRLIVFAG